MMEVESRSVRWFAVALLNQLTGSVVGARGSRIVRAALSGTALAALIAFVAAIQPMPHAQGATGKVAVADSSPAHIRTVADGQMGDIVALDDDWVQQQEEEHQQEQQEEDQATQQQLQTDQEIQEANQEAEEQNELATQEAQQAEQQGLMDEQQADGSFGFGQ
jgi:hypothetical protein